MAKFKPPMTKAAAEVYDRLIRDIRRAGTVLQPGDEWGVASLAEMIIAQSTEPTSAKASSIRHMLADYGLTPAARAKTTSPTKPKTDADPMAGL